MKPSRHVYPRGFPFELRDSRNAPKKLSINEGIKIGVNAGLWLKDPDIDATTWLNGTIQGINFKGPDYTVLAQDTWTPINTQNTAIARELIPAYICVPMGWDVPGGKINRYGDIWGGYFLQALMKKSEYVISFGNPIVEHRRNPHDYIDDLRGEYWGLLLTDWLLKHLRSFSPKEKLMLNKILELAEYLQKQAYNTLPSWCPNEVKDFIECKAKDLIFWANAFKLINH